MAVPVIASSTNAGAVASTSLSLSLPSGVSPGDLLILVLGSEANSTNGFTTPPSGFTLVNYASGTGSIAAFWRVADGSEGASVNCTQAIAADCLGYYLRVTGADTTSPLNVVGPDYSNSSIAHTVPAITTTAAECLAVIALFAESNVGGWPTISTGWAAATVRSTTGGSPGFGGFSTKSIASAGTTGSASWDFGSDDPLPTEAFIFAIAPPGAPPAFPLRVRKARQTSFAPDELRGDVARREGIAEDYFPPAPEARGALRRARSRPPLEQLPGRVQRREGVPEDFYPPRSRGPRFVKQRPPSPAVLRGRAHRLGPTLRLVWLDRELSLRFDLDVFAPVAFLVFARNAATGVETFLGTAQPGAMTIPGVALADGDYRILVEGSGRYWRGARYAQEWPVRIVGGEVALPLPAIDNLQASHREGVVELTWALGDLTGFAMPEDFGVWIAASEPVSTAGAPNYVVPAAGVGGYSLDVPDSASTFFVAVAARRGMLLGPVSTIEVEPEEADPDSPSGPSARIPDGDWGATSA